MKSPRLAVAALAELLFLAACGGSSLAPREILVDHADCARCGMLISRIDGSAEAVFENDDPRFFDDIGCLASAPVSAGSHTRLYVRSSAEPAWLEVHAAYFAHPASARTAMAYGYEAYSTRAAAESRDAQHHARGWDELAREVKDGRKTNP